MSMVVLDCWGRNKRNLAGQKSWGKSLIRWLLLVLSSSLLLLPISFHSHTPNITFQSLVYESPVSLLNRSRCYSLFITSASSNFISTPSPYLNNFIHHFFFQINATEPTNSRPQEYQPGIFDNFFLNLFRNKMVQVTQFNLYYLLFIIFKIQMDALFKIKKKIQMGARIICFLPVNTVVLVGKVNRLFV